MGRWLDLLLTVWPGGEVFQVAGVASLNGHEAQAVDQPGVKG